MEIKRSTERERTIADWVKPSDGPLEPSVQWCFWVWVGIAIYIILSCGKRDRKLKRELDDTGSDEAGGARGGQKKRLLLRKVMINNVYEVENVFSERWGVYVYIFIYKCIRVCAYVYTRRLIVVSISVPGDRINNVVMSQYIRAYIVGCRFRFACRHSTIVLWYS